MLPVSPVFHTEETVSIGLKNVFRVGKSILQYYMSIKGRHDYRSRCNWDCADILNNGHR